MLNISQCLLITSLIFCKTWFYFTKYEIESLRVGIKCFKINDLSGLLILTVFFKVDSLQPFSANYLLGPSNVLFIPLRLIIL